MTTTLAVTDAEAEQQVNQHIVRMAESWPIEDTRKRFESIALGLVLKDQALAACTPTSKLIALNECCRLGLIPDRILGHIWLIPFRNNKKNVTEVTVIPGYKGYIELARRSGHLTTINTDVVFANDTFEFDQGTNARLTHRPWWHAGHEEKGPMIAAWGIAYLRGEDKPQIEAIPISDVLARKARSHGAKRPDSPWNTDFEMMARKTVVRQMSKLWSLSPEQAYLQVLDYKADMGEPQFEIAEQPEMTLDGEADADPTKPVEVAQE